MSKTPFQDAQRAASVWIADELCAPRGWAAPPVGMPLCRMRLTRIQYDSLRAVMKRAPRPRTPTRGPQESCRPCGQAVPHATYADGETSWLDDGHVSYQGHWHSGMRRRRRKVEVLTNDGHFTLGTDKGYDIRDFGPLSFARTPDVTLLMDQ